MDERCGGRRRGGSRETTVENDDREHVEARKSGKGLRRQGGSRETAAKNDGREYVKERKSGKGVRRLSQRGSEIESKGPV